MGTQPHATTEERREQIMAAAMVCFGSQGFHQTTMHDISAQARISVGLIYRYFESKDAVIASMAECHLREMQEIMIAARQAPDLFTAFELIFECECNEAPPEVEAAFVLNLFAEAHRNPVIASHLIRIKTAVLEGVTALIADSREQQAGRLRIAPRDAAKLLMTVHHGILMCNIASKDDEEVVEGEELVVMDPKNRALQQIWTLLMKD